MTGTAMSMETVIVMEAKAISEEEWKDPPDMALAARKPLTSPLVCVYVDGEEEDLRHAAVQGDFRYVQGVGEGGGEGQGGRWGTVQGHDQAAV